MSYQNTVFQAGASALMFESAHALPNTTTNYTDEVTLFAPNPDKEKRYVSCVVEYPSSLAGNITTNLYGSFDGGTTKVLLAAIKSASSTAGVFTAQIDLNAYPAPKYYVGFVAAANDSSRNAKVWIYG